jgi:hypothetical protein
MRASRRSAWISGIALVWLAAISPAQIGLSQTGIGNTPDPRQTLVLAKTAAILAQPGEVSQTGRWMMDPSPERASNALQKALQKWGRLKLVEDTGQADLVLLIIEGNRSGLLKKGELFERLVVFPGGPGAVQEKTALWQEEAKEGLGGRPAGKLIEHLRKQIEEDEKSGSPVMSAKVSQSGPARTAVPPDADTQAEAATVVEAKAMLPSQAIAPAEARSDPALGNGMENRMLQPVPDKFVPSAELLKAKTAAVISFGPQPEGGTKGVVGGILTGTPSYKQANAKRAGKDVETEITKWKRYTLVDNPAQADIVIAVREWNHTGILGRQHLVCRMAVFKGGADFEQKLEMLWAEEYETDFGSTTKMVTKDFRRVVEKLGKQAKTE